ncbi:MAG: fibronectin type III domain-containing protein [Candidatus Peribacteraceae bacterium]|nr:fibronectin type III domain-containing protein [Candidatus Peribacteraceae bacterium]
MTHTKKKTKKPHGTKQQVRTSIAVAWAATSIFALWMAVAITDSKTPVEAATQTFTSVKAGNWSDPTVWGKAAGSGLYPGSPAAQTANGNTGKLSGDTPDIGDMVIVNHAVTVDVPVTVGISSSSLTAWAIALSNNGTSTYGSLLVNAPLVIRGSTISTGTATTGANITVSAGNGIEMDSSRAPSPIQYLVRGYTGDANTLTFNGTAGSRSYFRSTNSPMLQVAGNPPASAAYSSYARYKLYYTDVVRIGDGANFSMNSANIEIQNSTFNTSGRIDTKNAVFKGDTIFSIRNTTFVNSPQNKSNLVIITNGVAKTSGIREIIGCVFDEGMTLLEAKGFRIYDVFSGKSKGVSIAHVPASQSKELKIFDVLMGQSKKIALHVSKGWQVANVASGQSVGLPEATNHSWESASNILNMGMGLNDKWSLAGDLHDSYLLYAKSQNPHYVVVPNYSVTIQGNIFESPENSAGDSGDCIQSGSAPRLAEAIATVRNNIVLPVSTGDAADNFSFKGQPSCTLNTPRGDPLERRIVEHNTVPATDNKNHGILVQMGEGICAPVNQIISLKSNLAWSPNAPTQGAIYQPDPARCKSVNSFDPAQTTNNGFWNVKTSTAFQGTSLGTVYWGYASGTVPGSNDVWGGDPGFVDRDRGIVKWSRSLGKTGTDAQVIDAALKELEKRNDPGYDARFTIKALIDYVKAGFVPTNTAYKGTAHDGTDIGAMPVVGGHPSAPSVPVMSAVGSTGITATDATITWSTDVASDTQVEYGLTTAYGITTTLNVSLLTSHSQVLTGLSPSTTYHYRVKSKNAAGLATSNNFTFTTTGQSLPFINTVTVKSIGSNSATITWLTSIPADTQVEYGTTTAYGSATIVDPALVTTHGVSLTGLAPATFYHYRVKSRGAGGLSVSGNFTFTTAAAVGPGRIFYLSPTGSDANTCLTLQTACRQMAALLSSLRAGDTVLMADGDYYEFDLNNKHGEAGNPITIKALTPKMPRGSNVVIKENAQATRGLVNIHQSEYIIIDGLTAYDCARATCAGFSTRFSRNITILNSIAGRNSKWGFFTSCTPYATLINNEGFRSVAEHGFYISNSADNHLVQGNIAYDNNYIGFHINSDFYSSCASSPYGQVTDGIIKNMLFENNIMYRNGSAAMDFDGVQDSIIRNNVAYDNKKKGITLFQENGAELPKNIEIYHNTVDNIVGPPLRLTKASANIKIRNNIFVQRTAGIISTDIWDYVQYGSVVDSDYNIFAGSRGASELNTWRTNTPEEDNSIAIGSPSDLFVIPYDPANPTAPVDYRLKSTAAGINAGANLPAVGTDILGALRPQGAAWDIGAYEFGASIGLPPPPPSSSASSSSSAPTSDTTPPTLSLITAANPTPTGATITWTTNEAATTQVRYGTTISYGNTTTLNSSLILSHSQALSGLSPSTTYHYQVISTDGASNTATSTDNTFTTPAALDTTPPLLSSIVAMNVLESSATISWQTNENATTQIDYGTTIAYGNSTTLNPALLTAHSVGLSTLTAGTTYHYRVRSKDAAGNEAVSGNNTFTTVATVNTAPLVISLITATGIGNNTATISWTTNIPASTQVKYGTTTSYGDQTPNNPALTLSHSVTLSSLISGTTYNYQVVSTDATSNTATSTNNTFLTLTTTDTTSPFISATRAATTDKTATISWLTDEVSNSQIEYGRHPSYGTSSPLDTVYTTAHTVSIANLTPDTDYHYRVKSKDPSGNLTIGTNQTFSTKARNENGQVTSSRASSTASSSTPTITPVTPAISSPDGGELCTASAAPSRSFTDVPPGAYFADAIAKAAALNIVSGYKDAKNNLTGFFGSSDGVTAAQVSKMALIAAGKEAGSLDLARYVSAMAQLEPLLKQVNPNVPINRALVIHLILKAFAYTPDSSLTVSTFSDTAKSPYVRDIQLAFNLGIVTGYKDAAGKLTGRFGPNTPVSRADAIVMIMRALELRCK